MRPNYAHTQFRKIEDFASLICCAVAIGLIWKMPEL